MCGLHSVLVSEVKLAVSRCSMAWHSPPALYFSLSPSVVRPLAAYAVAVSLVSWLSRALTQGGRVPSLLLPLRSSDLRLDPPRERPTGKKVCGTFLEAERPTHENTDRRTKKKKKKKGMGRSVSLPIAGRCSP